MMFSGRYDGVDYSEGDSWTSDCIECVCESDGNVVCNTPTCDTTCTNVSWIG